MHSHLPSHSYNSFPVFSCPPSSKPFLSPWPVAHFPFNLPALLQSWGPCYRAAVEVFTRPSKDLAPPFLYTPCLCQTNLGAGQWDQASSPYPAPVSATASVWARMKVWREEGTGESEGSKLTSGPLVFMSQWNTLVPCKKQDKKKSKNKQGPEWWRMP